MAKTIRAWLTPDSEGGGTVCRPLTIRTEFLPIVSTLLETLTDSFRWENFGDQTPDQCAAYMREMMDGYYSGDCGTMQIRRGWRRWNNNTNLTDLILQTIPANTMTAQGVMHGILGFHADNVAGTTRSLNAIAFKKDSTTLHTHPNISVTAGQKAHYLFEWWLSYQGSGNQAWLQTRMNAALSSPDALAGGLGWSDDNQNHGIITLDVTADFALKFEVQMSAASADFSIIRDHLFIEIWNDENAE